MTKPWTVTDTRMAPLVTAPDAITQGLNVNFAIRADDLNLEMAPLITVDATNVPFGTINVTPVTETTASGVSPFTSVVNVQWSGLTAANIGTTTPIFFVVCTQSAPSVNGNCAAKKTMVTIGASSPLVATASTVSDL